MVYLSEITFDPGSRTALRLLGDTYALHRFLMMAFPEATDVGSGRVLFRVESGRTEARVLVQGEKRPDWRACGDIPRRIRGPKEWEPVFAPGQTLRFRVRANTTYKTTDETGATPRKVRRAWTQRHEQLNWLKRKGDQHGFALVPLPCGPEWFDPFGEEPEARAKVRIIPLNHLVGRKPSQEAAIEHYGVDFDGVLRVTEPAAFAQAIINGIGPAKGFGFGLLSIAPVKT